MKGQKRSKDERKKTSAGITRVEYARVEINVSEGLCDPVSLELEKNIRDLGLSGGITVRYVNVYTLKGNFKKSDAYLLASEILSDKVSQEYSIFYSRKKSPAKNNTHIVEVAYNPGVMDPVEDSVMKAAADADIRGLASVATSRKYILRGELSSSEKDLICEKLLYNKVIEHIVEARQVVIAPDPYVFKRKEIPITGADDSELEKISVSGQLSLSLGEMRVIKEYFLEKRREPTDCELETIAQTWSEHCKHKTMMGAVEMDGKVIDNLLKETVMKVTRELKKEWCVSVFKDNAGIIRFDEEHDICFKVETHNHPSALEPYGGAETGLGGVLRDIMGTGRGAKPVLSTDVFCFAPPDTSSDKVPPGALHPKRVMKGVVGGVRDYGNRMGIPTVNGAVSFHKDFIGNPLVYCGSVGIMPRKFSDKKVTAGDLIVAVGGRTGRDGIHGATFSSVGLTHRSEDISSTAVQIGDPITEKKVLDTLLKARDMGLYEAVTDCGAGGFSSAVGEMGEHTGARVYLEKVPLKYMGLEPWEIWISEAQERMVLAVKPSDLRKLMEVFRNENVEAVNIGEFTGTGKLELFYEGNNVCDIDMKFLHDGLPRVVRKACLKSNTSLLKREPAERSEYTRDLLKILSSWDVCSKEWIIRQYDHEVQAGCVLKPLIGVYNDGPSDAAVIKPFSYSNRGIAVSCGLNPRFGRIDPYWMAASAIDEALRQLVCVGVDPGKIALLDNFCWPDTEDPENLGSLIRAAQACYDIAKVYGTPFISGKDSLNNEFSTPRGKVAIPPTLLISAIGVVEDVRKTISMDIKAPGNLLYMVGMTYPEMGGSQYFSVRKVSGGSVPRLLPERSIKMMEAVHSAISSGMIISAHDCSEGGMATAVSEMLFAGGAGARLSIKNVPREKNIQREDIILFSESNGRFIVEVPPEKKVEFEKKFKNFPFGLLGKTRKEKEVIFEGLKGNMVIKTDITKLKKAWREPIFEVMNEG